MAHAFIIHRPTGDATPYLRNSSRFPVATGMARATSVTRADALTSSSRTPSLVRFAGADLMVSLREMKAMAQSLDPSHPLRVLVLGEPDEIPREEYAAKVVGWFRLIVKPVDLARPDGR
jgi:hypothetical protein